MAELASLTSSDRVLDTCCFIGGPAFQLADTYHCRVTGIDISETYISAANRIASLSGLSKLTKFLVADAGQLPFPDHSFSVVWNQGSLKNYSLWLREFDRVLTPKGRLAITFEIGHNNPRNQESRWKLTDVASFLENLGYSNLKADDITQRDIHIGWEYLQDKLSREKDELSSALGKDWLANAIKELADDKQEMIRGIVGNGRIVAVKN